MTTDPLSNALRLVSVALEELGIPYFIGGSIASSTRGIPRATIDIDLVARIAPSQAVQIAAQLGPDWYSEAEQIRESILRGRAFNLIHIPTSQKVDVFPAVDAFHRAQLGRATSEPLEIGGEVTEYPVATAEDILLAKLRWFLDGGEISDRQWSDITGIVANNPSLDCPYLETWAEHLGVSQLLKRALASW